MRYLLVEGITDVALIKYICFKKGITTKFNDFKSETNGSGDIETYRYNNLHIINIKGQNRLADTLKTLIKPIEVKIDTLAILQDADSNFEKSMADITQAIEKAQLSIEVKKFLTPNNKELGDLEILLLSTLKQEEISQLVCFREYEKCLNEHIDISAKAMDKARLYAYTMFAKEGKDNYTPQNSFMYKPNKVYKETYLWNIDHPNFQPIVDFVLEIFG